jgi:hypothetical protein
VSIQDDVDALYALSPREFTAARTELAKRSGDAEIRRLRRPSQAAAVVNRLARERREDVERLVEAGRRLRAEQARGGDIEQATRAEREALAALVRAARDEDATPDAALEGVRATMQAAAADDAAARQVLAGRLERELDAPGFGPLLAAAANAPRRNRRARPEPRRNRDEEQRRREAERVARAELRVAEREELETRRAWEKAQKRLEAARAAVERTARTGRTGRA